MPTYEVSDAFRRDLASLTPEQYARFQIAVRKFIEDLWAIEAGEQAGFRPGLRVKRVWGTSGLYEMTWAPDGRATFSWGESILRGARHVEWVRCGGHHIL